MFENMGLFVSYQMFINTRNRNDILHKQTCIQQRISDHLVNRILFIVFTVFELLLTSFYIVSIYYYMILTM